MDIQNTISSSVAHVPFETFGVLLGIFLFALIGMAGGKRELLSCAISVYPISALFLILKMNGWDALSPLTIVGFFAGIFLLSYATVRRFIFSGFPYSKWGTLLEVSTLSIATFGAIFSILLGNKILDAWYQFSPAMTQLFTASYAELLWLAAPLLALAIFVRR